MASNATRDLSFNVAAIDRTAKSFEKIALRLERLEHKLDKLDRKRVDIDVDVDTHRAMRQVDNFSQVATSATAGAVRLSTSNIYVFLGVIAAALAALPFAGAAAATGVVLAFGAGLAGLGIAAAAQNDKVRKSFADLKDDIGRDLKSAARPLEGVLRTVAAVARDVFKSLNLGPIFEQMAPSLSRFTRMLGEAFKALAPALGPLSDAFSRILDSLGPMLVPLFADIGNELTKLADVVGDNSDLFAAFLAFLLASIPKAIAFVRVLASAFVAGAHAVSRINIAVLGALVSVLKFAKGVTGAFLGALGAVVHASAKAFGWLPGIGPKIKKAAAGFDDFRRNAEKAFDGAISQAEKWKKAQENIRRVVEIKANIRDLESKLAAAKRKLKDPSLTKAQKKEIKGDIRDLEKKLGIAKGKLDQLKPATVKQVKGHIKDLESKLATARARIKDPTISAATRKHIRGNIRDLLAKIERAKAQLASIRDRTVYVNVVTRARNAGGHPHSTSYYPGRAAGGPVMASRSYLVGERGPEILTLGSQGGNITPNRKLTDGTAAGGEFTGNLYLDSGEFLGIVRGELRERDRETKRRAAAGVGGAR